MTSLPLFVNPIKVTSENFSVPTTASALIYSGMHWDIPFLYYPGSTDSLFVMTPSAVDRKKHVLPAFNRFTWAANNLFPGHVICISDQTLCLHKSMKIGWCIGSVLHDLSDEIANLVNRLAMFLKIGNDKITTWGSSAGGFSALAISFRIKNSTAVAINSQIDVLKYSELDQVDLIKTFAFGRASEQVIRQEYGHRVNIIELKEKIRNSNRTIIIQNRADTHHFNVHFNQFVSRLGYAIKDGWSKYGDDNLYVYQDARGHIAENETMAKEIIEEYLP